MTDYPGRNTEFYINIDGANVGPIKGLRELLTYPLTVNTPVWYDGLDDWMPVSVAPLTAPLMADSRFRAMVAADTGAQDTRETAQQEPVPPVNTDNADTGARTSWSAMMRDASRQAAVLSTKDKPKSYLGWAVAVTIVFNFVAGIIAIIYAFKVNSKFVRGNIDGAKRCSESAQWWIAISITLGLIMMVVNLATGGLF